MISPTRMGKILFLFIALSSLLILSPWPRATGAQAAEITLLHTKSVTGHLLACPT